MNRSRKNLKDLKPIKPIPPYDSTQGADLPEELLQGYEQNLSSHNAEQALKKSKKSIAAVKNKALSPETSLYQETGYDPFMEFGAKSTQVEQQNAAIKGVSQKDYWNNKTGAPSVDFNPKNTLNISELPKGTDLGGLNINYDTPIEGWDAGAAFKQDSNASSAAMADAGKAAASAFIKEMIAKIAAPKKEDMGAMNLPQTKSPDEDYLTALARMSYYS